MSETQTQKPSAKRSFPSRAITVEFDAPRNRGVLYKPLQKRYRGKFSVYKMPGRDMGQLATHPDTPGIRITLNAKEGTLKVFDPLGTKEGESTLLKAKRVRANGRPWEDEEHKNLDQDTIKTHLKEFRRLVDKGDLTVVEGELPALEEIDEMPGRVKINFFDSHRHAPKYEDQPDPRYQPRETVVIERG